MTTSNRLNIIELASTQVDRAATINEAIARLEAGATMFAAKQVSLNTPPGSPAEGDLYVIGTSPTGSWASNAKQTTVYYNAAWLFFPVFEGQFAYDQSADSLYLYDGSAWSLFLSTGGGAPTTVDYLVKTASGALSAERVVTDTSTVSWDWSTAGQAKANLVTSYLPSSYLDTDGTLAANSDTKIASQKATKTYVDQITAANDAMIFKGVQDCSANPNYPAADRGWTYRVSVAGKIGGASGINVEVGDLFICLDDGTASGNQATVGSHWSIAQANIDGGVVGPASATDGHVALFDGATGKLIKDGGAITGFVAASTTEVLTGTDASKGVTPDALAALWEAGADVSDGAAIAIGEGGYFNLITSTTAITSFSITTDKAGRTFRVRFNTVRTLTYNATSLIIPGSANVTTAVGDIAQIRSLGSGNVIVEAYWRADGKALIAATGVTAGIHTIWVPASSMIARTTNGAASGSVETSTNKVMLSTLDFDPTTQQFAQFQIRMPKSWNEGTITAIFTWSHPSTSTNFGVVWALEGIALSDNDAADTAFGTAQQVADTGGTTSNIYITAATSAITIGGSPAAEDYVVFQVKRVPSDGSDTMAVNARLHGVTIYFTTDADTDV